VYDIPLARLGLQSPGRGYQFDSGFPPIRITCLALHASAHSLADIGTLRRYSAEDKCGAEFNGSVLPVPSHRMCKLYLSSANFLKSVSERLPGCHPLIWNHRIFTWDS
jgi:hypothetical protein